jgi:hypothetical protein
MRSAPLILLLSAAACSKNGAAPTGADAGTAPPLPSGQYSSGGMDSGGASAQAATGGGACKLDVPPFVIDKGVRGETGVTVVRLADDRLAAGYASGEGTPKVAIVSPADGTASLVDVDLRKLPELSQKPAPRTQRVVHRVTPIGANGLKMRVAVDLTETRADGSRLVRCGPADDEPWQSFDGVSAYEPSDAGAPGNVPELRECRSFSAGGTSWSESFVADTTGAIESRWVVRPAAGALDDAHALVQRQVVPLEAGRTTPRVGQLDRFGYTQLTSARLGDAGFLVGARSNGKLRLAKRGADWSPADETTDFWYGSPIGLAALAARDAKVVVVAPIAGKLELVGATFPVEAKIAKPAPLVIDEPAGAAPLPPDSERTSVTVAIASRGQVIAAFLDGRTGKRRPRFVLLDDALKAQGASFEPLGTADADVADLKLTILPDDRVLVTALIAHPGAGLSLEAAVVGCGFLPAITAAPPPAADAAP